MKVAELLKLSTECKTHDDADNLLSVMEEAFSEQSALSHLPQCNRNFILDEDGAFARFEINRVISGHYVTMIRPEIRSGQFAVVVTTYHMRDGLGLVSQEWGMADGFEEHVVEPAPETTLEEVASQAKTYAIGDHCRLIEQVGVPRFAALPAAEESWHKINA